MGEVIIAKQKNKLPVSDSQLVQNKAGFYTLVAGLSHRDGG